jgi:hypothetical protein
VTSDRPFASSEKTGFILIGRKSRKGVNTLGAPTTILFGTGPAVLISRNARQDNAVTPDFSGN